MPKTRRLSDANLVRRSQQGDRRAFSALVGRYDWRLRGLAFALLLDQAEMDAALSASYLRSWRDIVRVSTKDDIAAWLYRNVYNACVDRLRLGRSAVRAQGRAPQGTGVPTGVVPVLAAMPEAERVALVLVDREGFDPKAAARIMGLPAGTVDRRLASARARLAEHLATAVPAPTPAPEPTAGAAAGGDERDTGDVAVTVDTPDDGARHADAADQRRPSGNGKRAEAPARNGERAARAADGVGAGGNGERAAPATDADGTGSGSGEDAMPASAAAGASGEGAAPAADGPAGGEGERGDEADEAGGDDGPAGGGAVETGTSDGNGAAGNGHGSGYDGADGTGVEGAKGSGSDGTDGPGVDGTDGAGADSGTGAGNGHGTGEANRGRGRRARKRAKHAATRTVGGPGAAGDDASEGSEP